jgi:hypothetical protein
MHNSVSEELKLIKLLSMDLTSVILVLAAQVHLLDLLALTQLLEVVALSQAALLIQKKDLNRMLEEASLLDDKRYILSTKYISL